MFVILFQCVHDFQEAIQKLYCDLDSNIASILLIASVNTEEQSLMTVHKSSGLVDYDELIVSMIQVSSNKVPQYQFSWINGPCHAKTSLGICGQQRLRSTWASAV